MKALGVGTALTAVGGAASAGQQYQQEDPDEDDEGEDGAGDGAADGADGQPTGNTVHTVETLITGSSNPERPADFFYEPTGLHVQPGDVVRFRFVTPDHNVVSYHPAFGMRRRVPTGVGPFSSPVMGWQPDSIAPDQIEPPSPAGGEAGDGAGADGGTGTDGETGADDGAGANGTGANETGNATGQDGNGAVGAALQADAPVPSTWLHAFEEPGVYDLLCSPHEHFGMAMRVVVGDVTEAPFEISDPEALAEPRAGPAGMARETLTDPALEPAAIVEEGEVSWGELEVNRPGGTATPTGTETDGGTETPTGTDTATETGTETGRDTEDGTETGTETPTDTET